MSKAFTKEIDDDDDDGMEPSLKLPAGTKNYITPAGYQRLREIDRRIRFLSKRMDHAEVVDPAQRGDCDQVFFSATVTVCGSDGTEKTYSIVGVDEADPGRGLISWVSPLARALLKAREADVVVMQVPGGREELEIVEVSYRPITLD